jgi:general nucleoside transport system permease protein
MRGRAAIFTAGAAVLAFAAGMPLIAAAGVSPLRAYAALLRGAFGSRNALAETAVTAIPLVLAGLGTSIAYRGRLVSIGAEGQILMGAVGAAFVGLYLGPLPPAAGIPLALLAGFLMGAFWGALVAAAKLKFGASELITSLMLNYVALQILSWLIAGPWKDPHGTLAFTALITPGARLPVVLPGTRLHAGIIVAAAAAVGLWYLLRHTVFGYQLDVTGGNMKAAEYAGIRVKRLLFVTMLLSGGLSGLAGFAELSGIHHRLLEGLSPGFGYTAIAIAMLGRTDPVRVVAAGVLFAALSVGGDGMQADSRVPVPLIMVLQGLVLLFVLGSEYVRVRWDARRRTAWT